MNFTEHLLEFDKVKALWKEQALTDAAKAEIDRTEPFLSELDVLGRLRDTSEARTLIEKAGTPPLSALSGFADCLETARVGGCLSPEELECVDRALAAASRLKKYLKQGEAYDLSIAYYEENIDPKEALREEISQAIRGGRVDDRASKELFSLRNAIARENQAMREKADTALRTNKTYLADHFSTVRSGHLCIPVRTEFKSRVSGNVIDQSATGSTVFIEPAGAARHYAELQLLEIQEENEVRRILYILTAQIGDAHDSLLENLRMFEKLDFIFSKGKLSLCCGGSEPSINTERRILLEGARHPLMDPAVSVPLRFSLGGGTSGIVITGPNTGGKTVALKTVALNCMMAQCGLHTVCRHADICLRSNFLCDIGDGQNLSENLSTFSAHIKNVLDILSKVGKDSLVIMDELGSGTDPAEGMGIAVAILEELRKSGALFLVTTHYPEVKNYAARTEGLVNARMTFDQESLRPTYQLVIGEAGESCAFYIAGRMGMPESMLRTAAKAAYGSTLLPETLQALLTGNQLKKERVSIIRKKSSAKKKAAPIFRIGDSVMVLPDKKTGIVCRPADEKGILLVQLPGKKIHINHKRVRLQVAASELYPEDYDFSIIFDTVENRKLRHDLDRGKMIEGEIRID